MQEHDKTGGTKIETVNSDGRPGSAGAGGERCRRNGAGMPGGTSRCSFWESTSPLRTGSKANPTPAHWPALSHRSLPTAALAFVFRLEVRLTPQFYTPPARRASWHAKTVRHFVGVSLHCSLAYPRCPVICYPSLELVSLILFRSPEHLTNVAMGLQTKLLFLGHAALLVRGQTLMLSACSRVDNEQYVLRGTSGSLQFSVANFMQMVSRSERIQRPLDLFHIFDRRLHYSRCDFSCNNRSSSNNLSQLVNHCHH